MRSRESSPYILMLRRKLPAESDVPRGAVYDDYNQLWINQQTGCPLVSTLDAKASEFGETLLTHSHEGVDQSEVASCLRSQFGETTITKTSEGADQSEIADVVSPAVAYAAYTHF